MSFRHQNHVVSEKFQPLDQNVFSVTTNMAGNCSEDFLKNQVMSDLQMLQRSLDLQSLARQPRHLACGWHDC